MNEAHEAATLFPMLGGEELRALADDIRRNGLIHPVVMLGGKVLDGRNRLRACEMAGVVPRFDELKECASPTAYVLSANVQRRQLTKGQLAMIAERSLPLFEAEAKARQRTAGEQHGRGKVPARMPEAIRGSDARDQAAAAVGVSPRYVSDAKRIRAKAPEVAEKVERGEVTMCDAKREVLGPASVGGKRSRSEAASSRWSRHNESVQPAVRTMLAEGRSDREIADAVGLKVGSVRALKGRLGLSSGPVKRAAQSAVCGIVEQAEVFAAVMVTARETRWTAFQEAPAEDRARLAKALRDAYTETGRLYRKLEGLG